jgi:TolB-like protein/tetratricopeptide (TPR) repeat protein
MSGLFQELKRRNVFRVAIAYIAVAWLILQVADIVFENIGTPDWVMQTLMFLLAIGFPLATLFSWAYEMTPEGLKKERDVDRSQSITQETGQRLNRLISVVLLLAVGFLLVDRFVMQSTPEVVVVEEVGGDIEKSVAVLPFVAMSSGPDDEYFADGITEEILNSLAQVPDLLVTARTSAFAFKGLDVPIPEIAAKLGVANVVEGSVRRSGDRLRVTAQLIRAVDGFHLWSETYDRSAADSFGVQDEIAEKVAGALNVVLDDESLARMRAVGLRNPEAFIAFQKGRDLHAEAHGLPMEEMSRGLLLANEWLDRVIELEPASAPAHLMHADYYMHFVLDRIGREGTTDTDILEALQEARAGLRRATEAAKGTDMYFDVAIESALVNEEWRRMGELIESALDSSECINPAWWAAPLQLYPDHEAVIELWRRGIECDPLDFYAWVNLTSSLVIAGRFDEAIDVALQGLEAVPHRQIADRLVLALIGAGRFEEALAANQRYVEEAWARRGHELSIAAAQGDAAGARARYEELEAQDIDLLYVSNIAAALGDRERANAAASLLDARPLGYMILLDIAGSCACGAPFDLEATPNLARAVNEAGLIWPPRKPIDWPLKNW